MKTQHKQNKKFSASYFLFLPFLFLTFCQEGNEEIIQDTEMVITKDSQVALLLKSAVTKNDQDEQCLEYKYPVRFYAYYPESQSIKTIIITSDEELFDSFELLTSTDQISIDFPVTLLGMDDEETMINSLDVLRDTLQVAVDACSGNTNYESCENNNKKAYVCHSGNAICVSVNAVQAHLDHGDLLGECN